ncbi:NACHT domain-containing protein [Streptomyces sp. 3N207]|uniref:NACHT domain-containing protein n=1 Tax=Streptomyces sp. 3N207 TaxID=3457417 RepID=UPI003FD4A272
MRVEPGVSEGDLPESIARRVERLCAIGQPTSSGAEGDRSTPVSAVLDLEDGQELRLLANELVRYVSLGAGVREGGEVIALASDRSAEHGGEPSERARRCEVRVTLLDGAVEAGAPATIRFELDAPPTHPLRAEPADEAALLVVATPTERDTVTPASRLYTVGREGTRAVDFTFTPAEHGDRTLRLTVYDREFGIPLQEVTAAIPVAMEQRDITKAVADALRRLRDLQLSVGDMRERPAVEVAESLTRLAPPSEFGLSADEAETYRRALRAACRQIALHLVKIEGPAPRASRIDAAGVVRRLAQPSVAAQIDLLFVPHEADERKQPLRRLVDFHGERNALNARDLRSLAGDLVRRAVSDPGQRPVDRDEDAALTDALARTLAVLGELEMSAAEALQSRPEHLAHLLKSAVPDADRALTEHGALLYGLLVDSIAQHVLESLARRVSFAAGNLAEQGQRFADLRNRLDELQNRPQRPAHRGETSSADAEFEEHYARDIAGSHGHLTLHGIDLHHTPGSWPLDAVYLSLRCEHPDSEGSGSAPVPVEQALAGLTRIFVCGEAGSGKTTLIQRLAVSTVQRELPPQLSHLHGRIPFVVPVRRLPPEGFPPPSDLSAAIGYASVGAPPAAWVERVLEEGRALLLIDGVDEVPASERQWLRQRLRVWIGMYPGNVWLVSARPSAVHDGWLSPLGFSELLLVPMSHDEVSDFVRRWHHEAGQEPSADSNRLDAYAEDLLRALHTSRHLGRLATNPLMCGLLCALYRDRGGSLPTSRKELYDAVLAMLLERRDSERNITRADPVQLPLEPKLLLLQSLAHRMLVEDLSEMDRHTAVDILDRCLPALPDVPDEVRAEHVYRHLLDRTGVLREPFPGTVEFVHDTFRDHLAAQEIVRRYDFDLLLGNAHRAEWEDVVLMAVAHARPDECAHLLNGLLAPHSGQRGAQRLRRRLLALACLEHVRELDPEIRARVRRYGSALVPPTSTASARALGWTGPLVLELLPDPSTVSDAQAYLLAVTATSIGDDMAIDYLALLRDRRSHAIRSQLAQGWRRYDTDRYAREIIAHLDDTDLYFPVSDLAELRALAALGGRAQVQVVGPLTPTELTAHLPAEHLTHLWLSQSVGVSMEWLRAFPRLRELRVGDRLPGVTGVPAGVHIVQEQHG